MCILDELYHEWHSPREKPWGDAHTAWGRSEALWDQAEKRLDGKLFEELKRSVFELMDLEACREFEAGFRLGAQLMLEVCAAPGPQGASPQMPPSSTASAPHKCPTPTL